MVSDIKGMQNGQNHTILEIFRATVIYIKASTQPLFLFISNCTEFFHYFTFK